MKSTSSGAVDLLVVSLTCFLAVIASGPIVDTLPVDPVARRVYALLLLQFVAAGAVPIALVAIRRQPFGFYGLSTAHLGRSLVLGAALAAAYLAAISLTRGAFVVVPFGRHGVLRLAANLPGTSGLIASALVVLVWGVVEGFFGVYFAVNAGNISFTHGLPRAAGRSRLAHSTPSSTWRSAKGGPASGPARSPVRSLGWCRRLQAMRGVEF